MNVHTHSHRPQLASNGVRGSVIWWDSDRIRRPRFKTTSTCLYVCKLRLEMENPIKRAWIRTDVTFLHGDPGIVQSCSSINSFVYVSTIDFAPLIASNTVSLICLFTTLRIIYDCKFSSHFLLCDLNHTSFLFLFGGHRSDFTVFSFYSSLHIHAPSWWHKLNQE